MHFFDVLTLTGRKTAYSKKFAFNTGKQKAQNCCTTAIDIGTGVRFHTVPFSSYHLLPCKKTHHRALIYIKKNGLWHCNNLIQWVRSQCNIFSWGTILFILMSSGNHLQVLHTIVPMKKVWLHNERQLKKTGSTWGTAPALDSTGLTQCPDCPTGWHGSAAGSPCMAHGATCSSGTRAMGQAKLSRRCQLGSTGLLQKKKKKIFGNHF